MTVFNMSYPVTRIRYFAQQFCLQVPDGMENGDNIFAISYDLLYRIGFSNIYTRPHFVLTIVLPRMRLAMTDMCYRYKVGQRCANCGVWQVCHQFEKELPEFQSALALLLEVTDARE